MTGRQGASPTAYHEREDQRLVALSPAKIDPAPTISEALSPVRHNEVE
jgi:hypothetical protein